MKLTKERKIFLGLLGVGLAALAVDRWGIGSPAGDGAEDVTVRVPARRTSVTPAAVPARAGAPKAVRAAPAEDTQRLSLAQRLRQYAEARAEAAGEQRRLRDAFEVPASWYVVEAAPPAPTAPAGPTPAERFVREHKLVGVLLTAGKDQAIVDGHSVTVGQTYKGFRLVSVAKHSAVFESGDARVTLKTADARQGEPGVADVHE
jgi:hypothetical protein